MTITRILAAGLLAMGLVGCCDGTKTSRTINVPSPAPVSLFDGKTLGQWKSTQFGGEGEVHVEDGCLILPYGNPMTGVTWTGPIPAKINYEITLDAKRVDGSDFFCALTFPVNDDPCSLIVGGWGGGTVGLSSLNGLDASENETSSWQSFQSDRWYHIRLRVEKHRIAAWIDDKQVVNVDTTDKKIGIRIEVDLSRPLGIATYTTTGAIKNIQFKPF
ncbi:MAG: DUF1080 domain-containing protein [Planctomycetes bacterium]|nr:DUF1080 domain-containing protein [Planctomycetota bacterium]